MDEKELKCVQCGKVFPVQINNQDIYFYIKKRTYATKVAKLTNIEQEPSTKYFCKLSCKETYIFYIRKKNWFKNRLEKEKYLNF